jgi:uncharacterized repeat protein (TIGR03833 family)
VQGFVTHHHHHHCRQFHYSALVCQTTSLHLSEEESGGRSEKEGEGGGTYRGRGRSRNDNNRDRRSTERRPSSSSSSSSTSGGDIIASSPQQAEDSNQKQQPALSYRERWFQAHPNMNNGNDNRRRRGDRNNKDRRGMRRERTSPSPAISSPGQPGMHCHNSCISPGMKVYIVKKEDQRSGRETIGKVSRLLTNSKYHPRGIKVMLDGGIVGRVTRFVDNSTSTNFNVNNHEGDVNVNVEALATLVGMDFDQEQTRKALQMFDNDVQRAVNYILNEED